jgi:hypothetical protein
MAAVSLAVIVCKLNLDYHKAQIMRLLLKILIIVEI